MAGRRLSGQTWHILAFVLERPRSLDELVAETGMERATLCRRLVTMVLRKQLVYLKPLRRRSTTTHRRQSRYALGTNLPPTMLLSMFDQRPRVAGGRTSMSALHPSRWGGGRTPVVPAPGARTVHFDRSVPARDPERDDTDGG